jgi:hypothetical protein
MQLPRRPIFVPHPCPHAPLLDSPGRSLPLEETTTTTKVRDSGTYYLAENTLYETLQEATLRARTVGHILS